MDPRSRRSADGLTELAQFVLDLPVDDERVRELATLAVREGVFMPFPEGDRLISRFRFDDPGQESERFLTELAAATRREAVDFAREHGALPDVD